MPSVDRNPRKPLRSRPDGVALLLGRGAARLRREAVGDTRALPGGPQKRGDAAGPPFAPRVERLAVTGRDAPGGESAGRAPGAGLRGSYLLRHVSHGEAGETCGGRVHQPLLLIVGSRGLARLPRGKA